MSRSYRASSVAFVAALICISLLVFLTSTDSTTRVSALTEGVGVYWDSGCGTPVSEIDWGPLNPGSVKNKSVYVQNEEDRPMRFIMYTAKWDPLEEAPIYLNLRWNYPAGLWTDSHDGLQINLTLSVSDQVEKISSFSFDILIGVTDSPLGDVDLDDEVDGKDSIMVGNALWSNPGDPTYNPYADVNCDGSIDGGDRMIVTNNLWEGRP